MGQHDTPRASGEFGCTGADPSVEAFNANVFEKAITFNNAVARPDPAASTSSVPAALSSKRSKGVDAEQAKSA